MPLWLSGEKEEDICIRDENSFIPGREVIRIFNLQTIWVIIIIPLLSLSAQKFLSSGGFFPLSDQIRSVAQYPMFIKQLQGLGYLTYICLLNS